ncbi:phage holin family protein [Pseudogemmobacter bohemicus]|uniref:phage holin family protein n=1 Tax=Pseudogemmobacter bohemicus TaxID=2250708 RepID=UPI000DD45567|nr:phage holin family protein [Pseudogemmobacter bohemicus]
MSGASDDDDKTPGGLVLQIAGAAMRLLRGEIALRKAEAREIGLILARALVIILVGLVLALLGLGQLADAGHAALVMAGLAPVWASLLIGIALCLVAAGLIWWQLRRIRRAGYFARREIFARGGADLREPEDG